MTQYLDGYSKYVDKQHIVYKAYSSGEHIFSSVLQNCIHENKNIWGLLNAKTHSIKLTEHYWCIS